MFKPLPSIKNNYTPWPKRFLGYSTFWYTTKPSHDGAWRTNSLGQILDIYTIFGLVSIGLFNSAQLMGAAQGYTVHFQIGHFGFAFLANNQRTCRDCIHYYEVTDYCGTEEHCDLELGMPRYPQSAFRTPVDYNVVAAWRCPMYQKLTVIRSAIPDWDDAVPF